MSDLQYADCQDETGNHSIQQPAKRKKFKRMGTTTINILAVLGNLALRIILWILRLVWCILVEIVSSVLGILVGCLSLVLSFVAVIIFLLWLLTI